MTKRTLKPPLLPMEAKSVAEIPAGDGWQYEPKWDGFRCIAFRDGAKIALQSKSGQPLQRYFPDVVGALAQLKPNRFILDGEIIVVRNGRLSFDDLLQRIHPAASRIEKLSRETPATYIIFDLLMDERARALLDMPLTERRTRLEQFARKFLRDSKSILLSPVTIDIRQARTWLSSSGAALDGVIAKRLDLPYQSGNRAGMQKIKRKRTAECVVAGFRYASNSRHVGSLLLGLYDDEGLLHHVGFTSSFKHHDRPALTRKLEALRCQPGEKDCGFTGRAPGGPSRWSTERSSQWEAVRPKLVVEIEWDHFSSERFRHGTGFLRWRPDKPPRSCTFDQVAGHKASVAKIMNKPVPKKRTRK
jgi:ATP-dependent DNA ligase